MSVSITRRKATNSDARLPAAGIELESGVGQSVSTSKRFAGSGGMTLVASLVSYCILIATAEIVSAYLPDADGNHPSTLGIVLGMGLHTALLFTLLAHAAIVRTKGAHQSGLFVALSAIPLIRMFSFSVPLLPLTLIQWLLLVGVPLLTVSAVLVKVLGRRPSDVGLGLIRPRQVPVQVAIGVSGLGLGFVEYLILRPAEPWISEFTLGAYAVACVAITLASGLAEELIFRGIIMGEALRVMGPRNAVIMVTSLFAVMHVGFLSPLDVAYVFLVGLLFSVAVIQTGCLYGVAIGHSLANIMLYLVVPFLM